MKNVVYRDGTLRKMLGHGPYSTHSYHIQTLQDNISYFTPEILDQVNQVVVAHQVMQKQTDDQVAVPMAEGAKKTVFGIKSGELRQRLLESR